MQKSGASDRQTRGVMENAPVRKELPRRESK